MTLSRFLLVPVISVALLAGCASTTGPETSSSAPSAAPSASPTAPATPVDTSTSTATSTPTERAGDAPTLTTEGFGDLRFGEKIPEDSTLAAFNEKACDGGGAVTLLPDIGSENDVNVVTKDRTLGTAIVAVVLFTDAFATKSGIRVGDSLDDLMATYGDELKDASYDSSPEGLYQVTGDAGRVLFQLEDDTIAAIGLVTNDDGQVSFLNTDGFSPCGQA